MFTELTSFESLSFSKVPMFYFGWKPPFAAQAFLQKRLWKCPCCMCKIWSVHFAVEQKVMVAAMMVARFILHASDVHQHMFNRSRAATSLRRRLPLRSRPTKFDRAYEAWILSKFWATGWRI